MAVNERGNLPRTYQKPGNGRQNIFKLSAREDGGLLFLTDNKLKDSYGVLTNLLVVGKDCPWFYPRHSPRQ